MWNLSSPLPMTNSPNHSQSSFQLKRNKCCRLHIGFIPFRWKANDLIEFVEDFGHPIEAEVICNDRGSKVELFSFFHLFCLLFPRLGKIINLILTF